MPEDPALQGSPARLAANKIIKNICYTFSYPQSGFFCQESYILSVSQNGADFGLQDKASTVVEAPSDLKLLYLLNPLISPSPSQMRHWPRTTS